jgi:penicillin amidase
VLRVVLRVVLRIVLGLLVVVLVLAGVAAGAGYWFVERTLPQTGGTIAVAGLGASVSVVRDGYGVPHLTGASLHDVAFAKGYVTAQDRLFHMEVNRRVAQGRLAEIFGPSVVDADAFLRTIDLPAGASAEYAGLDGQSKQELQAYADGVNAFVAAHKDTLPLEFSILGFTPAPWQPVDSLAYARVLSETLDGTWYTKYTRAMVLAKLGPDAASTLFPPYPDENPTLIQTRKAGRDSATQPARAPTVADQSALAQLAPRFFDGAQQVRALLGNVHEGLGSNDWVVDGTKTASGKPLLANDPHLALRMPAVWYEIALRGGGLDIEGFSLPGIPGVVIGHNDDIAWGVTNVDADNTDLYLETLDPTGHPGQYLSDGAWKPLVTRKETIKVRGGQPVTITVAATGHGPLLNGVVGDLKHSAPVALKWTALQPGYTFRGFFLLNLAHDWTEFNKALDDISISQNFVYADTQGNIGYRMSGLLPLRSRENDTLPVDGSTSSHDWHGYVPQDQMPRVFNPTTHVIVTANNRIVDDGVDIYVTADWDYGYRARRISDLLQGATKLTPADFARIQNDVYSIPAAKLAPRFATVGTTLSGDAVQAARILGSWDFGMTRDSAAAAIYEVTAGTLAREVLEPVLGKDLYSVYRDNFAPSGLYTVLMNVLADPQPPFFATPTARDAAIGRALGDAMASLRAQLGPDPASWRWGPLHRAHFQHPLATVRPLNLLFDLPALDRPGDSTTVNAAGAGAFSADPPSYNQASGPSMREIVDLGTFDNSLWVTTTGESGQPRSAHYSDLMPLWDAGRYQPMRYGASAVASDASGILTLQP